MHEAKISSAPTVTIWGTRKPRHEFLAVDDLADACIFVLKHYSGSKFLNVGTGTDITIAEFAQLVADVVGYHGRFVFGLMGCRRSSWTSQNSLASAGVPRSPCARELLEHTKTSWPQRARPNGPTWNKPCGRNEQTFDCPEDLNVHPLVG